MNGEDSTSQRKLTPAKWVLVLAAAAVAFWMLGRLVLRYLPPGTDAGWSEPVQVKDAADSWSLLSLHRWNDTLVGMGPGGTLCFQQSDGSWIKRASAALQTQKDEYCHAIYLDEHSPNAVFCRVSYTRHHTSTTTLFTATLTTDGQVRVGAVTPLQELVRDVFGEDPSRSGARREIALSCGVASVLGSHLYAPIRAQPMTITTIRTRQGPSESATPTGPSYCALLHSTNAGVSWQTIPIGSFQDAGEIIVHPTRDRILLLRSEYPHQIHTSVLLPDASDWASPELLLDTLRAGHGFLTAPGENTLHLCWMDMRLKKGLGFFVYGDWDVGRKNNLVYYRQYDDSTATWGREHKLSGTLNYCESPSMSVEGEKIVVAWHHYLKPFKRASIYFTVSQDNGQTWARPKRVPTSGKPLAEAPRVLLHKGVIHLLYNQSNQRQRNGAVVYQRREFPE